MLSNLQSRGFFLFFCGYFDFIYNVFIIFLTITRKAGVNRLWFADQTTWMRVSDTAVLVEVMY
jgi:hypothetical protein